MKHSHSVDRISRRNALKGMAVLSGAAVMSGSAVGSAADISAEEKPSVSPQKLGYRETEHVREYYRLARF